MPLNVELQREVFNEQEYSLVQVYFAKESDDVVPVDQIIIYPNQKVHVLRLPKGDFRIRAIDKDGKVLGQYEKKLK